MSKKTENQKNQRIQVFARCRPLNSIEKKQCSPSIVEVIPDKKILVKDRNANREFLFDKVFSPDTKQISVYKAVVEPLIQEVLMGYNCTVFAYGQTGTGKTYTMEGERSNSNCSWADDPSAGIIPRSLHQLFESLNNEEKIEFSVKVSFLELYNEELFDLLSSTEVSRLHLYGGDPSNKGSLTIKGLQEMVVNSKDEVYSILERGTARRQTAATMLNATSSRSHTVFSVTVHLRENTVDGEELLKIGKLNLVDLAGSENVGRSGAVDKRAREAGNINQSLLTLGRVITALIEKQPHVPYRESKLTRILQDSLGGHTKTSIIATISPALCNFEETISTLDYATKAKSITIKPEANQKMTKRALIREYAEEIERLQKDLNAARNNQGFYIDSDNYARVLKEIDEKTKLIQELSDNLDVLKEENAKIEEMLKITNEDLSVTNQKLDETSQKYDETAEKLSNTVNALNCTQKVLSETALERDEKQLLLTVQSKTERKLSQQAQKLLCVADETTSDVEKLHAKIDRKTSVEKINEEKCKEFRMMYQKQFAMLDDLVSNSEKQQAANLAQTKEDIDEMFKSLEKHQLKMTNHLTDFINLIFSSMGKISQSATSETDSGRKWTNLLLEQLTNSKETLSKKQSLFFMEKFPEFISEMEARNSEMLQWSLAVHKQISIKIEKEKLALEERSMKRNKIQVAMNESIEALCAKYDKLLDDFKMKSSDTKTLEDQFEKDFEKRLNDLKNNLRLFEKLANHRKDLRQNATEIESSFVENLETYNSELKEIQNPLMDLHNYESTVEEDKIALDEILAVMKVDEFAEKHEAVVVSQKNVTSEFEKFATDKEKEEELIFTETENALKDHLCLLKQNLHSVNNNISEVKSSLEEFGQSGIVCVQENVQEMQTIIKKTEEVVKHSEAMVNSTANQLKEEILHRDIEFEKFISEDLLKDIPTGTTPQRKTYTYPRFLAATSPHERILQRYRTELAANTSVALNLPLDSSFNELDEVKDNPSSLEKSTDFSDANNVSFSSNESADCDTDSCTSSVSKISESAQQSLFLYKSDASSIDSERNKENKKNSKKKSRLPKRLPSKGFLKPSLPVTRKPLMLSNSTAVSELSDV